MPGDGRGDGGEADEDGVRRMNLTPDDLRRARMYLTRPDLTSLAASNEWITALLDYIDDLSRVHHAG